MSELGYYRHVHYTLALMCAKNRLIVFCSLLDIRQNVLLDIRENVEWPRFLAHPVSINIKPSKCGVLLLM